MANPGISNKEVILKSERILILLQLKRFLYPITPLCVCDLMPSQVKKAYEFIHIAIFSWSTWLWQEVMYVQICE